MMRFIRTALILFFIRPLLRDLPGRLGFGDEVVGINDLAVGNARQVIYGGGDL